MTDDQTRSYETPPPDEPVTEPAAPAAATSEPAAPPPAPATPDVPAPAAPPPPPTASNTGMNPITPVSPSGGRNNVRWALGLGVAILVLVITAGAFLLLGGSSAPEALRYVPADSAMVIEARFDLPGDQMQKLGNLLAHFPGFADQSTLTAKIDEAFSRLVGSGSGGAVDYTTQIKPWLNGPIFISGDAQSLADAEGGGSAERLLVSATTNNAVACDTAFEGQTLTHETYAGMDLSTAIDGSFACVIDGRIGLVGDTASVKEAIDTKAGGNGMDKANAYTAARKSLTGEQLATVFISGDALRAVAPGPDASSAPIPGLEAFTGQIPEWLIFGLRAEDDAMVVDGVVAPVAAAAGAPSLLPVPAGHASVIASQVPAGTLIYFEDQGTGVSLQNLFTQMRAIPDLQAPLQMLDGVGGPAGLVGWIDDAAIAVSAKDPTLEDPHIKADVYLVAKDEAAAAEKLSTVRTFLGFAGLSGGGITVTTETISGVEVSNVTITDLSGLVPPGSVPGVDTGTLDTPVSFSIAGKGRFIYLTVGDGAMAEVLGVGAGASLADDAAFKLAAQRGLANSKTTMYVAVGATVDLVKDLIPTDAATEWAELQPYIDPVEAFGFTVATDPAATRTRMVLTVNHPQ